jgi:hypothetical protein
MTRLFRLSSINWANSARTRIFAEILDEYLNNTLFAGECTTTRHRGSARKCQEVDVITDFPMNGCRKLKFG